MYFEGNTKDPLLNIKESYPILIVPSNYGEGISRSIVEALILKIPVICSKTALSGVFNDKCLYYVQNNQSKFYKNKVGELVKNYNENCLKQKIGTGFNMAKKDLTEKIVQSTISIYEKLLQKNNSSYLIKKQKLNENFWLAQ